ncbi:phytoene/squalene synthase family protein [Lutimonas sp.]|uniref:phytoene/squalene synthase family protein n=1 Tax=Lutimonas sp. TaxID=1872403 RepID=UPI003D9B2F2D
MKELFDNLSYRCSHRVTTMYSTSFSLAVKMLSPKIQKDIYAIYGFVRFADEIVDSFHDYDKEVLLDEFEKDLYNSIERGISLNPILNAFQHVVHKHHIDHDMIDHFMKSMRADLNKQEYKSVKEYEEYIYGSADVVGLMCLKVFVQGDQQRFEELKAPAMKLGSAFQKVNFLRDLKDDTENLERSYFPHIKGGIIEGAVKDQIIAEINQDFDDAYIGIKKLPMEAKFGVYTAYVYYKKLLRKLNRTEASEIQEKRIRISNPMKMFLLTKSFVNYKLNLL